MSRSLLRRFHGFALPGDGCYRVQPVFVGDVADLAVCEAAGVGDRIRDAAGPEVYTFEQLCRRLADAVGKRAVLIPVPVSVALTAAQILSHLLHDVVITSEEIGALMAEMLISHGEPTASTRLFDWLGECGSELGRSYSSELKRHWSQPF